MVLQITCLVPYLMFTYTSPGSDRVVLSQSRFYWRSELFLPSDYLGTCLLLNKILIITTLHDNGSYDGPWGSGDLSFCLGLISPKVHLSMCHRVMWPTYAMAVSTLGVFILYSPHGTTIPPTEARAAPPLGSWELAAGKGPCKGLP